MNGLKTLYKPNLIKSSTSLLTRGVATQSILPNPYPEIDGSSFGASRLQDYYHNVIQENLMVLKYQNQGTNFIPTKPEEKVKTHFTVLTKGSIHSRRPPIVPVHSENIPELDYITIQTMMPEAIASKHNLLSAFLILETITGERATTIYSRSNVALWKLRSGMPIGAKVVLKGAQMYQFLDKLVEVVLPRIKEYKGFSVYSGDGTGNLAMGFPKSAVGLFPDLEIIYDTIPIVSGFHVQFNTTGQRNHDARLLLSGLGLPFNPEIPKKQY
ncbi:ribosomal protein L5 [Conidiobolus coronatus NRRL 28638]|uniref:Ribosomal protein L5 n=1 Tax=Conidiobolus coronatus (strain ATCC 28846 / CBS 209.66 / NRRL 28638) TaxID=796925 RepID=A0A137PGK2_CONC2|nr:ribosomal protein L5 [Conidiobolus coronatus NRRL 28638]|eukprot:KXN74127.1 ribosomal protein L5 [Conidiobolus coronatus NRRL 28638]